MKLNNHLKLTVQYFFQRARKFRLTQAEFSLLETCKDFV